jgi:hypothetical protein
MYKEYSFSQVDELTSGSRASAGPKCRPEAIDLPTQIYDMSQPAYGVLGVDTPPAPIDDFSIEHNDVFGKKCMSQSTVIPTTVH